MSTQHTTADLQARAALRGLPLAADPARVGRTHRVVRERALVMQEARHLRRTLWLPLTIASVMMMMLGYAIWSGLAQYDVAEISGELAGSLHDSSQMMVIGLWFLPVTATALFFVWLRRSRNHNN
jgi:ABC-type enterobactin transport system permease subunit